MSTFGSQWKAAASPEEKMLLAAWVLDTFSKKRAGGVFFNEPLALLLQRTKGARSTKIATRDVDKCETH